MSDKFITPVVVARAITLIHCLSSHSVTHVVHIRIVNFALQQPLIFKYSKLRQTEKKAIKVINRFADEVIRKRRQELIETVNKINNNEDADAAAAEEIGIHRKKRALLDILLTSTIDGKPLTDLDIREECDVFLFGVIRLFLSLSIEKANWN